MREHKRFLISLCALGLLVLVWSGTKPHDYFTWFLEVFPIFIALPILFLTHTKFPLTSILYLLILFHATILMVGGHYTYALVPINEIPPFNWLRDTFDLSRNYYDRVGHFVQGFVPAMIAREVLLRKRVVKQGAWLFFVVCCICLSISACYEFVEWCVAVASGTGADAFLGTQGDVWDTQWDMLLALIGAVSAQILLAKLHDKQLRQLEI